MIGDERLAEALRSFYAPEPTSRPDPLRMTRRVLDEVHHMPQDRGAWLRLPWSRRVPRPPAIPDTDVVPAPISATNGHTPTVTGRTQLMFSPAKALITGTLVFALGGVLMIARPFDQQGSAPPGAATDGAIDPCATPILYISGDIIFGYTEEPGTDLTSDIGTHGRGQVYISTMDLDDDRLDGQATTTLDWDVTSRDASIHRGTIRIENEAGAWEGPWPGIGQYSTLRSAGFLTGSEAYEGLSAMLIQVGYAGSRAPIEGAVYPTDIASCEFTAAE